MNYRNSGGRGGRTGGGRSSGSGGGMPFRSRGGSGPRGGRGGYSRGGRGGRGRDLREAAQSGNKRERIAVESGQLVIIDQFMLANPQFVDQIVKNVDATTEERDTLVKDFGGCIVSLEPGTYRIERDPFAYSIMVHPEGARIDTQSVTRESTQSQGHVFIDTRCLAMIDRELLDDSDLLVRYQDLWFKGEEKACRDLLRDNGGAVRYGFQRYGDELGVYVRAEDSLVCLWPDVVAEGGVVAEAVEAV
ncbi:MAG: hypothetical protein SGJ02_05360 [bacterium]|nr:hypothetical protein [bacterium]